MNNKNGFEPGALALMIRADVPENLGKVVELISSSTDLVIIVESEDGQLFKYTNETREVCWVVSGNLKIIAQDSNEILSKLKTAVVAQNRLMPLKGDDQDFKQEEEERDVLLSLSH